MAAFIAMFFAVDALGVSWLRDPTPWLKGGGLVPAAAGVALLIGDVVLPVPSSVVMVAEGAAYGPAVGAAVSTIGGVGAGCAAFALGRKGGPWLDSLVSEGERARAAALFERWGLLALAVSRPVPVLAETIAILAGASTMSFPRATLAFVAGTLPPAVLYGWAGARSSAPGGAVVFLATVAAAGALWVLGRRTPASS
jgi:uncharacterized membrane protein YdjX (TVP38/TMEM64 family)